MSELYPQTWDLLAEVVDSITYTREPPPKGCRRFELIRDDEHNYARLDIFTYNPDTYAPERMRYTRFENVVPVTTFNKAQWTRWVFDRIRGISSHEDCESFQVDGVRVYAPHHGNGWDPMSMWFDGHPDEQAKAPGDD